MLTIITKGKTKMKWNTVLKTAVLTSFAVSLSVQAGAFNTPEKTIDYRQAAFTMIATNFGEMADMIKGKQTWDAEIFQKRATAFAQLAKMPQEAFELTGTDGENSKAKAKIWQDWDGFNAKFAQFEADADKLAKVAAAGGDKRSVMAAFGLAGKNCKSCHDVYKYK